ncbi:MAG: hypothetical protein KJ060_06170, partial [Candidatus Hydrogenedentes bacterium]|nr:hypothetical protein [Candidatus Hydrogenedentota bacterium]
ASVQAAEHAPLASFDLLSHLGVHSKTSVRRGAGLSATTTKPRSTPKVFEFFHAPTQINPPEFAWLRASSP